MLSSKLPENKFLYSAYDNSELSKQALAEGSFNGVQIAYTERGYNPDYLREVTQKLITCKSHEVRRRKLIVGKSSLHFQFSQKSNGKAEPKNIKSERSLNNYSTQLDDCILNVLKSYESKMSGVINVNY
jgi:hypothetical protein